MPKVPAGLHPSVQAAVDATLRDWIATNQLPLDDERRLAVGRYQAMRQKRGWWPFAALMVSLLTLVFSFPAFETGSQIAGNIMVSVAGIAFIVFLFGVRAMRIRMTELAALAPALRLTRVQRAYLDAKLALHDLQLAPKTKAELGSGLERLVDEEARLLAMRDGGVGNATRPDALRIERDRLAARLAAEGDPVAREALAYGLATCERRLAAAESLSVAGPRIDAQLEMIGQSAEDVRDGLSRLRIAPVDLGSGIDLEGVRQALAYVQGHAAALEAAVAEVRALENRV